ncbi:MAG: hypothetical protein AAFZ15_03085 [Bacteroidota bacterium]
MENQTIVHGRILINTPNKAKKTLEAWPANDYEPWLKKEMFNLNYLDSKYFYEQHALGFSATYKNLEGGNDLEMFVLNMESILSKLDFETAKIQLETEMMGTFDFFWLSKKESRKVEEKEMLVENKSWYFGMGHRNKWGHLLHDLNEPIFPEDFNYPIKFKKEIRKVFNLFLKEIEEFGDGSIIYLQGYMPEEIIKDKYLRPLLMYLKTRGEIDFKYHDGVPDFITKLKPIEKVPIFCLY